MNNGEYYSSKEYNQVSEYKSFPAEIYCNSKEINSAGKELAELGAEITTIQRKDKKQKSKDRGSVLEKVLNSLKTVATTATVAVTAIVVTTAFVVNDPDVSLVRLESGSDYVEYEMNVDNMSDDVEYSIVVSTSNEEPREYKVKENGSHKNRIDGLKPSWEYTISLVGEGSGLGRIAYFEAKFQTTSEMKSPVNNNSPPKASYQLTPPKLDDLSISWGEGNGVLTLPVSFKTTGEGYKAYLVAYGDTEVARAECIGESVSVSVPDMEGICTLKLIVYKDGSIEEEITIGAIDMSTPYISVLDAKLSGIDKLNISFEMLGLRADYECSGLTFELVYPNGSVQLAHVGEADIEKGSVIVPVSGFYGELAIGYSLYAQTPYAQNQREIHKDNALTVTSDEIQSIGVFIEPKDGTATFYLNILSSGAEFIKIESDLDESVNIMGLSDVVYIFTEVSKRATFTIYRSFDGNGEANELLAIKEVDATVLGEAPQYIFNYKNPTDVGITYNEDGTMNLYIKTDFECDDADIYYQIMLGDRYVFNFREPIARIYNLPRDTYGIKYSVCKEIDGVIYSYMSVTPSGAVGESSAEYMVNAAVSGNTVTVEISEFADVVFDLSSARLISSNGEEIVLTEADFVSSDGISTATVAFREEITEVTLYIRCNQHQFDLEGIDNIVGDAYETITVTFYS